MPWSVEIHHIDLHNNGDSTLIRVREIAPLIGGVAIERNILIDGGLYAARNTIDAYLTGLGIATIHVIVCTHYDADHFYGLRGLFQMPVPRYANTIVFDQGEQGNVTYKTRRDGTLNVHVGNGGREQTYTNYINAIATNPNRIRVTEKVISSGGVSPILAGEGWRGSNWLLNKEILWCQPQRYDANGEYNPRGNHQKAPAGFGFIYPPLPVGQQYSAANPDNADWDTNGNPRNTAGALLRPAGAPTLRCIAVNQYVRGAGAANPIAGLAGEAKNEKSLAFVLQHNNFKYYIGGDIEDEQEVHIMQNLNPTNDIPGRILSMKASHHGAATATSRNFVTRMRPSAVIISCGTANQYSHPKQRTVNVLDGYSQVPILADTANENRHPDFPPPAPFVPISNYLTGYQIPNSNNPDDPVSGGGYTSKVAGNPGKVVGNGVLVAVPPVSSDIVLSVNHTQSLIPVVGQIYRGIQAAANNAQFGGLAIPAAQINTIANAGSTYGVAAAVALAAGATALQARAAINATAHVGTDVNGAGVVQAAIAAAGNAVAKTTAANGVMYAGPTPRALAIGVGVSEAVGYSVAGETAVNITQAIANVGGNVAGRQAAGHAANLVFHFAPGNRQEAAGFTAAAAMGAGLANATMQQSAVIAAAIGAQIADLNEANTALLVTNVGIAAGMANNLAAFVGAIASATFFFGEPPSVNQAVNAALTSGGQAAGAAAAAGVAAQAAATIVNPTLFSVDFQTIEPGVVPPINHTS